MWPRASLRCAALEVPHAQVALEVAPRDGEADLQVAGEGRATVSREAAGARTEIGRRFA